MKSIVINKIESAKIVAIIRSESSEDVRVTIENLVGAGITALEITSNTPNFCEHITWARSKFSDILIGAGTIINIELAEQAIQAGSQFIVTPNTDKDVIRKAQDNNITTLIGTLTPTEIASAINYGADFIKVFPAGHLGIDYFKAMLGPFRGKRFIAVGAVNISNIASWFLAGAVGVGIGGTLTQGSPESIKDTVHKLLAQLK